MAGVRFDYRRHRRLVLCRVFLLSALIAAPVAAAEPVAVVLTHPQKDDGNYAGHRENLQTVWRLLRNGFAVHWVSQACDVATSTGRTRLEPGDYLVPLNQPHPAYLKFLVQQTAPQGVRVSKPFTCRAYPLHYPRILLDAHTWAGNYNWYYETLAAAGLDFDQLYEHNADSFDPQQHNLFVVPGGGGKIPADYNPLLKQYVQQGGNYLGSCWGCAQALYPSKVTYGTGNGAGIADAHNSETSRSYGALGGIGPVTLKNEVPEHPLMWHLPARFTNIYWNGPVMRTGKNATSLATLVDVDRQAFQFHVRDPAQQQRDAEEEFGKSLYAFSQRQGEGKVIVFGCHPEATNWMSPFSAPAAGPRAIWNALLFATCDAECKVKLPRAADVAPPSTPPKPSNTPALDPQQFANVALQATQLQAQLRKVVPAPWSEDTHTGCYVSHLDTALGQLAAHAAEVAQVDRSQPRGLALAARAQQWATAADATLNELAPQVTAALLQLPRSRWYRLAGPALERFAELSVLADDVHWWQLFRG